MPRFHKPGLMQLQSHLALLAGTNCASTPIDSEQTRIAVGLILRTRPKKNIPPLFGEKNYRCTNSTMMPTPTKGLKEDNTMIMAKHSRTFQSACRIWFCPTDEKIAKELRKMSQIEREKVWADLSGNEKTSQFRKNVAEDPAEIDSSLNDLQEELDNTNEKPAFDMAQQQSPEYVNSRTFRLSFLRSCEYDGKRAGRMLIDHMETKRRLFGDAALGRDIRLDDLNDGDKETLHTGGFQFLRERDSAGRLILYYHRTSLRFRNRENFVSFGQASDWVFNVIQTAMKLTIHIGLKYIVKSSLLFIYDCSKGRVSPKVGGCSHLGYDVRVFWWSRL